MSHFTVAVLVRKGQDFKKLLEPFDENTEVKEYDKECYCVGRIAKDSARAEVEAIFPLDKLRKELEKRAPLPEGKDQWSLSDEEDEARETVWTELLTPRVKLAEKIEGNHPLKDKPDKGCNECEGTGRYKSTYNPLSKWDWYEVGGRWKGKLNGRDQAKVSALLGDWKEEYVPFALVTPDGEWVEKGVMGWWGMVRDPKKINDWRAQVKAIYQKYNECSVVMVDCHI